MSLPVPVGLPAKRQRGQYHQKGNTQHIGVEQGETGQGKIAQQKRQEEDVEGRPDPEEGEEEFRLLEAVATVQDELNSLEEQEAQEVLLVHKAYLNRKRPLYSRRQAAISKVPDFWLKVLLAHPVTQPWISDVDQLALSYLESIAVKNQFSSRATTRSHSGGNPVKQPLPRGEPRQCAEGDASGGRREADKGVANSAEELDDDDDMSFRVIFTFRQNPFFSNRELWKQWETADGQQTSFAAVQWHDTEEARDLQCSLLWNLDSSTAPDEIPSFFSIFCDDIEDFEVGEALRGDITENPLDIYMRHDFDAEADEEDMAQAADSVDEGEEANGGGTDGYTMEQDGGEYPNESGVGDDYVEGSVFEDEDHEMVKRAEAAAAADSVLEVHRQREEADHAEFLSGDTLSGHKEDL